MFFYIKFNLLGDFDFIDLLFVFIIFFCYLIIIGSGVKVNLLCILFMVFNGGW